MLEANATNGVVRQVAKQRINTADAVNEAIRLAAFRTLDMDGARVGLAWQGNNEPTDEQLQAYAYEYAVLRSLQAVTRANTPGQLGKWDFSTAQTVHDAFNSYLGRRLQAQRSRWNKR